MLRLENICKSYDSLQIAKSINLHVSARERHVILGPNGAGKTSLFNMISGQIKIDSGKIFLHDRNISHLSVAGRAKLGLGRSFQQNNLFDARTLYENLAIAAAINMRKFWQLWQDYLSQPDIIQRVDEIAELLQLTDILHKKITDISYGQRRKLEIGLALIGKPSLLLLDEPTSGLSPDDSLHIQTLLTNLPDSITILMIEHDMKLALSLAQQITVLNYGAVVFQGTPAQAKQSALVQEIYMGAQHA